jgi:spore photoproduct lyase
LDRSNNAETPLADAETLQGAIPSAPATKAKLWRPRRAFFTKSASEWDHGRAMAERMSALGIPITSLDTDRLPTAPEMDTRRAYALAKSTVAVVTAHTR